MAHCEVCVSGEECLEHPLENPQEMVVDSETLDSDEMPLAGQPIGGPDLIG